MEELHIGKPAPAFTLPDENGTPVALASFRGKQVIVYFYPMDDTPGCTAQACNFRDHIAEIEAKNGVVIGISPDDATAHQKFRTKYNLPFILLSDPDHIVAEQFGVWGEQSFLGKKYLGITRSHFVIDAQGNLVDIQINVKAKASTELAMQMLAGQ
jgi:peroxiredoxin Q/BCP